VAFMKKGSAKNARSVTCKHCSNDPITYLNGEPVCADHVDEELANQKKASKVEPQTQYLN